MANYGISIYGASKYGVTPRLAYSVAPMDLLIVNYNDAYISWQIPSGTFSKVKLVRSQTSYPEHSEDGFTVWEETNTVVSRNVFRDAPGTSDSAPIVSGKPIYYKMFLFTGDNVWVDAGSVSGLVPANHNMQNILVDTLPRVFTSVEQSPLALPDENSDLYGFLSGYSFTLEEALTYLDVLNPDHTLIATPASLLPIETYNVGLVQEQGLPIKNQKKLVREAIYLYTNKGTKNGLGTYVEALTGYAPTITVSENLLLTVQDSTFYKSTGNWTATNGTISSSTEQVPSNIDNSIDLTYTCKIVAGSAGSMVLGKDLPITKGVPLTPGTTYTLSANVKSPSSAGSITPAISLYDKTGTLIGTETSGTSTSANNTWKQTSLTKRASKKESQAVSSATGNGSTITYTTYNNHTFIVGTQLAITGFSTAGFNKTSAIITGVTTTTFTIAGTQSGTSLDTESGVATNNEVDATYAGLKFSWSAAGTYYIDMVCVQEGSSVSYDEARAIDVYVAPNKTNFIKNPSFETNVTDSWTKTGSVTVTQDVSSPSDVYSGTKSAKLVATDSWTFAANDAPTSPGSYYTASVYYKASAPITCTFIGKDSLGSTLETHEFTMPTTTDWTRFTAVDLVGYEELTSTYQLVFSGGSGTYYLDSVMFEKAQKATEYFDGSLPEAYGAVWSGATDNSYTSVYFSKLIKIPRIAYTLKDWVPENSFWRLRSDSGLEYTSIQV